MKKIMLSLFILVLLVGTISAFEFDNVKVYDDIKKEYTITNALGFGDDIAKLRLLTPLNFDVPIGYQKVAEFTVENYDNYTNVFNNMEFYDTKKSNELFVRDFDYKFKTVQEIPKFRYSCNDPQDNKTALECSKTQVGVKNNITWTDINKATGLLKGNITIGIFTTVEQGDVVEWIPTLFGERLTAWSVWTAALNVDLIAYWTLDNVLTDSSIFSNTLTNNASAPFGQGRINNGTNLTESSSQFLSRAPGSLYPDLPFSFNVWINPTSFTDFATVVSKDSSSGGRRRYELLRLDPSDAARITVHDGGGTARASTSSSAMPVGSFTMLTFVANGVNLTLYFNGSVEGTPPALTTLDNSGEQEFFLGVVGAEFWDGIIDEASLWNRSLSPAEIIQLYNDGSGIQQTSDFGPTTTLNSPVNAFNTTNQIINFNGTFSGESVLANVTLFIDGILNETNSSGINSTNYLFTKTIADGNHNWTYEVCDEFDCDTATTRTFTVDTTPIITVNSPTNTTFTTSTIFFNATTNKTIGSWIVNYNGTNVTLSDINTSLTVEDGFHQLLLYADNSVSGIFGLNDTIFFTVDTTPIINVTSPTNITFQDPTIFFNATTSLVVDNFIINYNGSNVTIAINTSLEVEDGFHQLLLYANNSDTGIFGLNDSIFFTVDTTPTITVNSPTNTTFTTSTIFFNATTNKTIGAWIVNYNGTNVTLSDINTSLEVEDGNTFHLLLYANNSDTGIFGLNDTIFFTVDATAPQVTVTFPNETIDYHEGNTNISVNWTVSDTNLDTCILQYEGINATVTCLDNSTTVNITNSVNRSLILFANDSLGNVNSSSVTWNYKILQNTLNYNSSVVGGTTELFILNVTKDSSLQISTVDLVYNLNASSASFPTGDVPIITENLIVPNPAADTNFSFYFSFLLSDSSIINTSSKDQTVLNFAIGNCSTFTTLIYNFTMLDEVNDTQLSNVTINYAFNLFDASRTVQIINFSESSTVNPTAICINQNLTATSSYSLDAVLEYISSDSDYLTRYYNILNFNLRNSTVPNLINIYAVSENTATPFQLTFRDSSLVRAPNILVNVNKQFVATNDFRTVEIPITDTNGQTILNLVRNIGVYNLIFIDIDGNIIASYNKITAFCQDVTIEECTLSLDAPSTIERSFNLTTAVGMSFTLAYTNSTSTATLTFNSLNSTALTARIVGTTNNQFGNRSVCDSSLTSTLGTVDCDASSILLTDNYLFIDIFANGNYVTTRVININPETPLIGGIYGTNGFFLAFMMLLFIIILFADDKKVLLVMLGIGWVVILIFGLVKGAIIGSVSGGIWLLVSIVTMLWKLNTERSI